jgi:holo-[acyl-carrier protein] synthase
VSIGIDILEPDRLQRALERRPGLRGRLFTDGEVAYASSRARPEQHLAGRFCAKEAVTKALGLDVFAPHEIELVGGGKEASVRLHGAAAERAAALRVAVSVSMTHVRGLAAAVAVLVPDPPAGGS